MFLLNFPLEFILMKLVEKSYLYWFLFFFDFISVPPNIDDSITSSDLIVRESSNVTLRCRASGSPTPSIKWKRDDNSKISITRNLNGK